MKKLLFILLISPMFIWAQKTHTVGPKETLFSIGRLYNVHPRELADYNKIPFEIGVKIGQVIKIPTVKTMAPLTDTVNATVKPDLVKPVEKVKVKATEKSENNSDMVAIYHKVQKKENLFQISNKYNNVSIDDIRKWNKLTSDAVNEGVNLIVGYQKKSNDPVVNNNPAKTIAVIPVAESKVETKLLITPKTETPAKSEVKSTASTTEDKNKEGGYFKKTFSTQSPANDKMKTEKGTAAAFKSTSGWEDGKYYCLYNTAPAGTIIKITNQNNQKFIYAKVLDVIPDLKQNEGILIRLSNAAQSELGAATDSFEVILNY